MYYVYRIDIAAKTRYVGYTNDVVRREKQHNYLCFKVNKKKKLYDNIKALGGNQNIELKVIMTFKSKIEAKRYECYLILADHFNKKELWQNVPKITDM